MKLYANVTSERASKGQGGNKYINIVIKNEKEDILMGIMVEVNETKQGDLISLGYSIEGNKLVSVGRIEKGEITKGEKLKTATCGHGISKQEFCDDCIQH